MKPTRFAVWVNVALATVWLAVAVYYFTQGRPGFGAYYCALLVFAAGMAVWSERRYRRWRQSHREHLERMAEIRDRYERIRREARARIEALGEGDAQ